MHADFGLTTSLFTEHICKTSRTTIHCVEGARPRKLDYNYFSAICDMTLINSKIDNGLTIIGTCGILNTMSENQH